MAAHPNEKLLRQIRKGYMNDDWPMVESASRELCDALYYANGHAPRVDRWQLLALLHMANDYALKRCVVQDAKLKEEAVAAAD